MMKSNSLYKIAMALGSVIVFVIPLMLWLMMNDNDYDTGNGINEADSAYLEADVKLNQAQFQEHVKEGFAQYKQGNPDAAVEAFLLALKYDSLQASTYSNLCACYNLQQKWDVAIVACEKALEIQPDFPVAQNNLTWALGELEKSSSNP